MKFLCKTDAICKTIWPCLNFRNPLMNVLEVNQVHFYILPSYQYYSSNLFNPALLIMEWMLMEICNHQLKRLPLTLFIIWGIIDRLCEKSTLNFDFHTERKWLERNDWRNDQRNQKIVFKNISLHIIIVPDEFYPIIYSLV